MRENALDTLLDKLCSGDPISAQKVFVTFEPYLRIVVRRQLAGRLRAKLDSSDIVQSVWADLVEGFRRNGWRFKDADHLRAFLVKVTSNRFLERARGLRGCLRREEPFSECCTAVPIKAGEARPSDIVQADELWKQMLALCPSQHHELLALKRQGLSLSEIAARTGLHEGSVRRILYSLRRRLAVHRSAVGSAGLD